MIMEPIICKGTKSDFTYLISMALQNRMQWKVLDSLFQNLAPNLNETREIISILLKELEALKSALQEKERMLKKYQGSKIVEESEIMKVQNCTTFVKTETIKDNTHDDSPGENRLIENDIEVLELGNETINEENCYKLNEGPDSLDLIEDKHHFRGNDSSLIKKSIREIDIEWYMFVSNDKPCYKETDITDEGKEIERTKTRESQLMITSKHLDSSSKAGSFQCSTCLKLFSAKKALKRHERSHTGKNHLNARHVRKGSFKSVT